MLTNMGDKRNVGNGFGSFVKRTSLVILAVVMVAVPVLLTSQFVGL
jgi:hypothetical protein